jgi:hypothetical protein
MPLYDDATFKVAGGHFYTATVGSECPADLSTPGASWTEIGHTSLDDIFSSSSQGGDVTTLGTLQAATLRSSTSARSETWTFNLAQFDEDSLKLYFGANATYNSSTNLLDVPDDPTATVVAFLAVFTDGDNSFAFHAKKAELRRGDDWDLSDTSSLVTLPISVTPVNYSGAISKYSVTPIQHSS